MPTLSEGLLSFTFSNSWEVTKYDDWLFYARFEDGIKGTKAMDFLAFEPTEKVLWLIEIKDYRSRTRNKPMSLCDEITLKARDTLAGVFAAAINDSHPNQAFARSALTTQKFRVVLHLEQTSPPSKLFPRIEDLSKIQQKLKQTLRTIDAHPKVVEVAAMGNVPWTATFL